MTGILSPSLGEAMSQFLSTLKESEYQEAQQELSRFVRWCGRDRKVSDLSPPEVGEYVEWHISGSVGGVAWLEPVKRFLSFLHRRGLTKSNLATHVKVARNSKRVRHAAPAKAVLKTSLTKEGHAQLLSRLEMLKEERLKVLEDIQQAMADKDFRENAPLEAAKERQGFIEGHIRELEEILAAAEVTGLPSPESSIRKVSRSSKVTVRDVTSGKQLRYTLVDPREADPLSGKISFASPVGQALLGHSAGEEVSIMVPKGVFHFLIEKVEG